MTSTSRHESPIPVPASSTVVGTRGPWPFVSEVTVDLDGGKRVRLSARTERRASPDGGAAALTWRIGLLFVIGSTCFVVGPVPAYGTLVGGEAVALTFFLGSIFVTTAAYLSFLQVIRPTGRRWFGLAPRQAGYWATLIQLVGTVYFNVTTFVSLFDVPADLVNRVVWRPDAIGSLCFLVSSALAFAEAGHRWWSWRPGKRDWHITALNLWGSVFFGFSAIGAYVQPTGELTSARWSNGGTFLGAVCFLVASVLTMGEGRAERTRRAQAVRPA